LPTRSVPELRAGSALGVYRKRGVMTMNLSESYYPADQSEPLINSTIGELLREAAAGDPERLMLVDGIGDFATRRRMRYREVLEEAEKIAHMLAADFSQGERIAVWAPNSFEWILLEFAAAFAGLPLVMINPAYRREEVRYVLSQSKSSGLFFIGRHRDNPIAEILNELRGELPTLRKTYRFEDWQQFLEQAPQGVLPDVKAGDAAMIQYTSGTTGNPKGAVLTHFGVVNNAHLTVKRLALPLHSIWLLSLPMHYTAGSVYSLLSTLCNRGTLVMMREFEPGLLIRLIEEEKVRYFQSVPTVHIRVVEHPEFSTARMASLTGIGSGGTTVPEELVHRLEKKYGAEYHMIFGQTELSSVVTHTGPGDTVAHKAKTIGVALPHIEMKVIDPETGAVVPCMVQGEICVRGFGVMKEYFELPEQTTATIDVDGWLHTGDLGTMENDGYLTITGRLKDMIIRGGVNVFPREIEDVLAMHPAVIDAAVVGIPDREWGEQIAAAVRLKAGKRVTSAELVDFTRERIARHKVPRIWKFVDDYPLTPSGKIKKFELRKVFVDSPAEQRTS
jgi:fatty-acyl-CoA synthase